ncbi:F-box/LRR-repeat protein 15 [Typha latifolia]|uniref:F-box/LRR-repeat protein 15 n=1 Tax=Typha latifolia TaxID=4733 RepID=UPI003C2F16E1
MSAGGTDSWKREAILVLGLGLGFTASGMADRRMKAVADGDGVGGDDEVRELEPEEEEEELVEWELGLSLGRRGWKVKRRQWNPTREQGVGSSRPLQPLRLGALGEDRLGERAFVPLAPELVLKDEDFPEVVGINGGWDMERDSQHKRPKVIDFGEACHCTDASSSGAEASALLNAGEHNAQSSSVLSENEMAYYLSLFSNDGYDKKPRDATDGGGADGNSSGSRNVEDIEIRMDLSDDLLHLIFSFLGQKDLCRAGATCKQWLSASAHEDFWRCLKFENTGISFHNFATICHRYQNATELSMSGIPNADVLVMEAMTSLRRLETIFLERGQLGDEFFRSLTECPALTTLSICDASLGNGIQEISVHHDRLRDLHIMKCRVLRISVRCPQLQKLSLKRTSMAHALLHCPLLHELDLSSCHKLSDAAIRSATTSCPLLASLDMSSCSCLSDETLREIAFSCPNLCVLDVSNCPNISFESVRLPMLIDLKLHTCEGITAASMSAISHSRMLEALQLDNCGLLTSVSLDMPHLRNISLVHLRKFVDLNLRSPVLSYIKVSRCSALHRISITSNALQKLVLQKQESLSTLSLQCHNLIEVDLSDCESLINSVCEVFSDGGGCPMLRSLILDNCESLSMVRLSSSSLISLSLADCRSMTFIELSCPNLQKINLDGCDHLEKASFCPVGLESLNLGICPKLSILQIEAPKMSILELKGCGMLSQASINCPRLTSLDASFCRQLLDDSLSKMAASCPHIQCLILSSCLSIGVDGLSSLHWLRRLTLLDLSYTFLTNLRPVFDSCSQLKILKLSACKYLTDSSLEALYKEDALPALLELDLSYSSVGQTAILELLACCTNLVHVNLNGCTNLNELVWGSSGYRPSEMPVDICPSNSIPVENNEALKKSDCLLEVLNCTGCPNIKKVLIPLTAHCLHLSKINLNLSTNLKEVDLMCFNLCTLNLSNCSSLEVLKLDCPRLTNLQLLACIMLEEDELESAISHCEVLETLNLHSCPKINAEYFDKLRVICPSLKRIQSSLMG